MRNLKARLRVLELKFGEFDPSSRTYHEMHEEIQDLKKKISEGEKLEYLKKRLNHLEEKAGGVMCYHTMMIILCEIEKVKPEIKGIEEIKSNHNLDAINYCLSDVGLSFGLSRHIINPLPSIPEKTYHIVTQKDDPRPHKIKINERTEKTIIFYDYEKGGQSERMFISDFLKNYNIHESFD